MKTHQNKKEKVKETLIFQILSGSLKIGDRIPPERIFCTLNNVSRITVRAALAELESERIIEKRGRKGIFVRSKPEVPDIKKGKTRPRRILYIFFSSLKNHPVSNALSFGNIFRGIDRYVNERGGIATLQNGESFLRSTEEEKRQYDGIIVGGTSLHIHLPEILKLNIPLVIANSLIPGTKVDTVSLDFHEAGYIAAKKLNDAGFQNLLLLGTKYEGEDFLQRSVLWEYRGVKDYCFLNKLNKPVLHSICISWKNIRNSIPPLDKNSLKEFRRILSDKKINGIISSSESFYNILKTLKNEASDASYEFPRTVFITEGGKHLSEDKSMEIILDRESLGFEAAKMLYERLKNPYQDIVKKII
ncbi:MAG: hypothetical protein A2017_01055 [Lentisphaerae bacterium GWF2_44_16]|nr:MAG: hypothetical protein A2017_01055 [Lentisphaerae bacterium GWF2_44_16]